MTSRLRLSILVSIAVLWLGGTAGGQAQRGDMTFFITSAGSGKGADLGGLAGADQICQMRAQAAGAGGKTWRAYLSTQGSGVVIAKDVAELHGKNNVTKETG